MTLETVALGAPGAQVDLTLMAAELDGDLGFSLRWNADLFDTSTAERMSGHFTRLLAALAAAPERRVAELEMLGEAERRQLVAGWNRTRTAYPREATVHGLFEEWAAREPERVALAGPGEDALLTYGELNARANRLARHLRAQGVGRESLVGVALERSPEMVIAFLAILKAGGAYVPLDPSHPRERLATMAGEAGLSLLLTAERWLGSVPAGPVALPFDRERRAIGRRSPRDPRWRAHAGQLAYAMFTSGSTGRPKTVGVEHRAIVRLVRETAYADFGPDEVFLHLAPAAFDAATLEIWGALLNGGRLALMPPGVPAFAELAAALERHRVTTLWLTAGLFHQVVEGRIDALRPVRQLLAGGDVLSPDAAGRFLRELPGRVLINGYGPTEGTTFTCAHRLTAPLPPGQPVPIGRPIANTQAYLLDRALQLVPVGVPGELFAGGDGLARGYLGRPDWTAERFVPSPFPPEPGEPAGERLYRTGDLARRRPDGDIEFLGRIDQQVKIRGHRVEPGEVEAALALHPQVGAVAVGVRADPAAGAGARRLVAWVVAEPAPAAAELRGFLKQRLPEPMVPAAFVFLPALPLTPNGKVDRRALPDPEDEAGAPPVLPRSPVEDLLAEIWADLLGRERVGIHDDFFALGGHSLLATRAVARLREPLGIEPPLHVLFENPTVAGFAAAVERARRAAPEAGGPPLVPVPRDRPLPLSYAQERLWFLDRLAAGGAAYNVPAVLRLRGPLHAAALSAALAEIARRHEALRTVFEESDGTPAQRILPPSPLPLPAVDLSALAGREAAALRLAGEEARRPFDLARGPLLRAALLRLAGDDHLLLLTFHHAAFDGASAEAFLRELEVLYAAGERDRPSPLPELAVQYADYAVWQRERLEGGALAPLLAWWRERLAGAPVALDLPTDRPRPAAQRFRGGEIPVSLPPALARDLRRLARREGGTLFAALLAGFAALLQRYTGADDLILGTAVANRGRAELEPLIGFFANTLPLRADLGGEATTVRELLARLRETALGAWAHQEVPFERLVEELQPRRDLSRSPLFEVMLVLRDGPAAAPRLPGLAVERIPLHSGTAKFDLTLSLAGEADGLGGTLEFDSDLFDAATVERMAGHLATLLAGLTAGAGRRLIDLPLLTPGEERQLVAEWNATARPFPRERGLHQAFEERAARTPDGVALIWGNERWTCRQLDRRADRLAARLRRQGVGPEVLVGIYARRSPRMIVAMLAALKAGGAYLPLDPAYPGERVGFLLADSGAPVLLAEGALAAALPGYGGVVIRLDDYRDGGADDETAVAVPPAAPLPAERLAYVIYTSGSTGVPKGVAITHRNAAALVAWAAETFPPERLERVLAATSIGFDLSVFEIFVPLALGGAVVLAEDALALPDLAAAAEVTLINTVPSAMAELLRAGGRAGVGADGQPGRRGAPARAGRPDL